MSITYCAVVKYPINASDPEKLRALTEGLGFIAAEIIEMGYALQIVEDALDEALSMAQDEYALRVEREGS